MMLTEYFLDWARGRGCAEAHAPAPRPAAVSHSTFSLSGGDDMGDDHCEAVAGRAGRRRCGSFVDGYGD